jgi:hypothetical protein
VKSGLGFYAVFRESESIPIQMIIDLFRKGIGAPKPVVGALN